MTHGRDGYAGRVDADGVDVAADGVGREALLHRGLADREVEAAAAVADVDEHAALLGGQRGVGRTLPFCTVLLPAPL